MLRALKFIVCISQMCSGKGENVSGIFPHLDSHNHNETSRLLHYTLPDNSLLWLSKRGIIPEIWVTVRENKSCARKYLHTAQKSCNPQIFIICAPKHLVECADIYLPAGIFLGLRGNILGCTEMLSLSAENYSLCAETYVLVRKFFVSARKLLCPKPGFWGFSHFRNAVVP